MKKITLILFAVIASISSGYSQANLTVVAPPYLNTTTNVRAPNGTSLHAVMRGCFLVQASELTGLTLNSVLTSFGFSLTAGCVSVANPGTINVYLVNTTSTTYTMGTSWTSIMATPGITQVYSGAMTIPVTAASTVVALPLSPSYVYTGGGLYVAYDWSSSGPFDPINLTTAVGGATYAANNSMATGGASADATVAPAPTVLSTTAFRPVYVFKANNTLSNDVQVLSVFAPGKVINQFNTPHTISAVIKNASNVALNNVNVGLAVTGANTYGNLTTIPTMAAGATQVVTLGTFNPQVLGANTISVGVASDQNNANNVITQTQSVTCNIMGINPATGTFTDGVGFPNGTGIITNKVNPPTNATLTAVRLAISSDASAVGKNVAGVILDAAGNIMATTNTIVINSTMGGNFQTLNFATPQSLGATNDYYIGMAQITSAIFPLGAQNSNFIPSGLYYTSPLTAGAVTALNANLGYFGIEPVMTFSNTFITATTSQSVICRGQQVTITANGVPTSYTWTAGSFSATTSSIVVTPTANTTYTVVGVDAGSGCRTNVATITQSVSTCTGLMAGGVFGSEIKLAPNPVVNGKSTISGLDGTNKIIIFNVLGQLVSTQTTSEESYTIDLYNQPNGTYLVKIIDSSNNSKTVKIVNQN